VAEQDIHVFAAGEGDTRRLGSNNESLEGAR